MPAAERRLERIARRSPDRAARAAAVRQVVHPRALRRLARKAGDAAVRRAACSRLDSLETLFACFSRDPDAEVRWCAIDRARSIYGDERLAIVVEKRGQEIRDESLLASLVFEAAASVAEDGRENRRFGDDSELSWRTNAPELELAAIAWIQDPGFLAYLACHHENPNVREIARNRYPNEALSIETMAAEMFPYGCPTCQYVSSDPLALRVAGRSRPDFTFARVACPRCRRSFDVSPSESSGGTDWVQNLSNGPLFWEIRDCPRCHGCRTLYRVEFPRVDQSNCRRCGWSEEIPV